MSALPVEKNLRILVIDDTRAIHDGFRKILGSVKPEADGLDEAEAAMFGSPVAPAGRLAFEIDSAYQGAEGIQLVQAATERGRPYALAFVDVRMPPGCDGIQASARLWQIDPNLEIVICTAYADYSWGEMMARVGHSDRLVILKKPFEPIEVLQLANTLTEKWRLHREAALKLEGLEDLVRERTRVLEQTNQRLETEIAQRKAAQAERERLIAQLQEALAKVKTLSGLVPICAECKQVRDDQGFWTQVEAYVTQRSDARFTHGLCPQCAQRLYPEFAPP